MASLYCLNQSRTGKHTIHQCYMRVFFLLLLVFTFGYPELVQAQNPPHANQRALIYSPKAKGSTLTCKLSSPEQEARKSTMLASLQKQVRGKKELKNGYAFRFENTDAVIDELTAFIKAERTCCDFFAFGLRVPGDGSDIWLDLTGPAGVKEFITAELGF